MNASVLLTPQAEQDLEDILRYTLETWGGEQVRRYAHALDDAFENIATSDGVFRLPLPHYSDVFSCRCEQHIIFFVRPHVNSTPIIIAIFHKKMDILVRLSDRISPA
jgi:toxin ParE1/3/4